MKDLEQRMAEFMYHSKKNYNILNRNLITIKGNNKGIYVSNDDLVDTCIIGKFLTADYKSLILEHNLNNENVETLFYKLGTPVYFKDFPIDLLFSMQSLHDNDVFWDEEGLSALGYSMFYDMLEKYRIRDKYLLYSKSFINGKKTY